MRRRTKLRKIKEVLRLKYECKLSVRSIAGICKLAVGTTQGYINRAKEAELTWIKVKEYNDIDLEIKLFPEAPVKESKKIINYEYWLQELAKPNVTLALLWEEYKETEPEGYQYSRFCQLMRKYQKKRNYSMRQIHIAGEKTFVDFGEGLNIINSKTGEQIATKLFVSVWGASNYTFAKATLGEDLHSWISVNNDALEYFGCSPKVIVPDNLKSGVNKACRYEPEINPTYTEFAEHYGVAVMPARPYKPKDKSKAENGVLLAKRWILARLRNKIFTSLAALNEEIAELLEIFNEKMMKKIKKSRKELFDELDKKHALELPEKRYEYAEWKKARVNINYHIEYEEHNYSVPYSYIHEEVEIRASMQIIEVIHKGKRICSHRRSYSKYGYTTEKEHMPVAHQKHIEWTPERILKWAEKYGEYVKELVEKIMSSRKYPEQAYKSCLGIIRLEKRYTKERLNGACKRALTYRNYTYKSVKNILDRNLDNKDAEKNISKAPRIHENVRGEMYYTELQG
ncbi:MAG: IS21 family transposase [archaeon]|nr:IS21 family transposase [archaeon]